MNYELPDFTNVPLDLFMRSQRHVLYQLSAGSAALALALISGPGLISALLQAIAAIALVIGLANLAAAFTKWRSLKKNNFAAIGKIAEAVPLNNVYIYKIEFNDCEGILREIPLVSQGWEKTPFKPGDKVKLLYNPQRPQDLVNYSAYEALKK